MFLEGTYVGQDRGGSPSPTCERIEQGVAFHGSQEGHQHG